MIRLEAYDTPEGADIVCKAIAQYFEKLPNAFAVIQPKVVRIRNRKYLPHAVTVNRRWVNLDSPAFLRLDCITSSVRRYSEEIDMGS